MTAKAEISEDRQKAHRLMLHLGWSGWRSKNGKFWNYQRADTGGMYDSVKTRHMSFGTNWVGWICATNEIELKEDIQIIRNKYIDDLLSELAND